MLRKLDYSVTFPTSNRTLSEAVLFQGGFGAITGPNESGKSMIVEIVRYCLFGSAALRGKGDDYKSLKASLTFTLRGQDYLVERTSTKAALGTDGQVVATGIKPVNIKIASLLGFNLDVFDMSCIANQDRLTELGDLAPTERRRQVDSVIGVAVLDDLAKWAGDEQTAHKRAADDLLANLREPLAPMMPEGYRPSAELLAELLELEKLRSEADQLRGWLATEKRAPSKPVDKIGIGRTVLQEYLDEQTARKVERQVLEAELKRIPAAPDVTEEELAADEEIHKQLQAYRLRRQFETVNRKVEWDQAHIDKLRTDLVDAQIWKRYNVLCDQIKALEAKGNHICPSCTHQWPIACEELQKLETERDALVAKGVRQVNLNGATEDIVDGYQRMLDAWLKVADEWENVHSKAPAVAPKARWTLEQIAQFRIGIANQARRQELVTQLDQLKSPHNEPDYAAMLRERQQYEAQLAVWSSQVDEYEAWEKEKSQKMIQLAMLEVDLQGHAMLGHLHDQARNYEQYLAVYEKQLADYNRGAGQVAAYRADAEDWKKVKEALQILRSKIKQYLVPSLNNVASALLYNMTGGDRQAIVCDEDFNITVDGQEINTLSGSGKGVANLALRLGLGQVLTNNVLSLFMGDEIDASMDAHRAKNTSQVLRALKDRISQLVLISHKFPAADYHITVGGPTVELREMSAQGGS